MNDVSLMVQNDFSRRDELSEILFKYHLVNGIETIFLLEQWLNEMSRSK